VYQIIWRSTVGLQICGRNDRCLISVTNLIYGWAKPQWNLGDSVPYSRFKLGNLGFILLKEELALSAERWCDTSSNTGQIYIASKRDIPYLPHKMVTERNMSMSTCNLRIFRVPQFRQNCRACDLPWNCELVYVTIVCKLFWVSVGQFLFFFAQCLTWDRAYIARSSLRYHLEQM
jgi:hypothetical protein